jgi:hypothetical protein
MKQFEEENKFAADRFESALKKSLRREEPPLGFSERVLAKAASGHRVSWHSSWREFFRLSAVRWAPAIALLVCLAAGGVRYQTVRREHADGEAAKQRLLIALRITGSKWQLAQAKVNEIKARTVKNSD